jgi:serine O-acetyltransferase
MKLSLPATELASYLQRQLVSLYPDGEGDSGEEVKRFVAPALERVERCFANVTAKGFRDADGVTFRHRHTDQYAIFLYYFANTAFRLSPGHPLAEKAYGLNKILNGLDAFFEVELPEIFLLVHPVGTVLGRAKYADYFCVYQNVTVGSNLAGENPSFDEGVTLYGGSRIIGACAIGANTMVSTGAIVIDQSIADNSLVFGVSPANTVKPNQRNVKTHVFGVV